MTDFRRYVPAEWLDDGVALLVEYVDEIPKFFRRAPWKALAFAGGLAAVATTSVIGRADDAIATDPLREYNCFVDEGLTIESDSHDIVPDRYWSQTMAKYVRGLPRFVEEDEDLDPDPLA